MTLYRNSEGITWRSIALSNGIRQETFHARIRRGMTPEEAATKPVQPYFKDLEPCEKLNHSSSQITLAYRDGSPYT